MAAATARSTKDRLVAAMTDLVRQKGFAETRVDDLCAHVGVSKGAFFHHFESKDTIAIEASKAWCAGANQLLEARLARYTDPVEFLLGYLDERIALMEGETWNYACYAGSLLQEVWQTHPEVGSAAADSVNGHIDWLTPHVAAALDAQVAREVSTLIQATIQGALIIAKADKNPLRAQASLRHLKTYVTALIEGSV